MTTLDDRLRARLAEIRAAAGVPHAQVSLEVLYFLPKGFLDLYADLFTRAVKLGGESERNAAQQASAAVGVARGKGAKTTGRRYKKTFVVQDEKALRLKEKVDRRLRELARDIKLEMTGADSVGEPLQCSSCRKFVGTDWAYCAYCGQRVMVG